MAGVGASVAETGEQLPMPISQEVKRKCVELKRKGHTAREIYINYFAKVHQGL